MADKEITNLPASQDVTDETLFVVYQPGEMEPAQKVSAEQLKQYTNENIAVTADNIKKALGYTPADPEKTVGVETQTFTDAQKEQARKNIGAVGFGQLPDIVCSAQGEVISLSDSSNRELKGLRIFGKTTQDGTPTPENPVELVSVGDDGSVDVTVYGKNLVDIPDKTTSSANTVDTRDCFLLPDTYTLSFDASGYSVGAQLAATFTYDDGSKQTLTFVLTEKNRQSAKLTKVAKVLNLYCNSAVTLTSIQLEHGAAATAYEPYKLEQILTISTPNGLPGIPVTSGGNYTDANGQQWICDEIDFTSGKYVQRVHCMQVIECNGVRIIGAYARCQANSLSGNKMYSNKAMNTLFQYDPDYTGEFEHAYQWGELIYWFLPTETVSKAEEANEWLSEHDFRFLYVLREPIETPLTAEELAQYAALHTNYPNTTIFNDGGAGMEVSYVADTKLYIDNKFAELAAAFVSNA